MMGFVTPMNCVTEHDSSHESFVRYEKGECRAYSNMESELGQRFLRGPSIRCDHMDLRLTILRSVTGMTRQAKNILRLRSHTTSIETGTYHGMNGERERRDSEKEFDLRAVDMAIPASGLPY